MRIILLFLCFANVSTEKKLEFVQVIFRHGDRAPLNLPYSTDKNTEESWPEGWGQLTQTGLTQTFNLGRFLHLRYGTLIYIRSSKTKRAIDSARQLLIGLFSNSTNEEYKETGNSIEGPNGDENSVIDVPTDEYDLLCNWRPCGKAFQISEADLEGIKANLQARYADLFDLLSNVTGKPNFKLEEIETLQGLNNEIIHNLTQPEWVKKIWPNHKNETTIEIVKLLYSKIFTAQYASNNNAKLYHGFRLNNFIQNALNVSKGQQPLHFIGYSSHDYSLMGLMVAFGFDPAALPPFASMLMMEVYSQTNQTAETFEVEIYYRNSEIGEPQSLKIPGCGEPCLVSKLPELYKEMSVNTEGELDQLCYVNSTGRDMAFSSIGTILLIVYMSFIG